MAATTPRSLVLIGSGPGIGQAVAALFASKRYNTVALVARRQAQLDADRQVVESAAPGVKVHTYVADVAESSQLKKALDSISTDVKDVETVYFNPAIIRPSTVAEETEEALLYDFKITNTALLQTAQWALPQLTALAKADSSAKPSLLVTGTWISRDPYPAIFPLSMVKAAQRNFCQSLAALYGEQGVRIAMVRVMGLVKEEADTMNPKNIAARAWELFDQPKGKQDFELEVN